MDLSEFSLNIIMNKFNKSILIVDDDLHLQKMYGFSFSKRGFDIDTAANGSEALDKIREAKFDVILLDIMLPRTNGLIVLQEIRKSNSKFAKTPVIAITNLGQSELSQEASRLGANKVLVKNQYTPSQVVEEVCGILGRLVA